MINFEIAGHLVYDGLELQRDDDAAHGTGMLALLTRRDTHLVDCYRLRIEDSNLTVLDVTERWKPRNLPLLMRVITTVVPVFRRWPTTYQRRASLGPQGETTTGWRQTSAAGADDYRRATGTLNPPCSPERNEPRGGPNPARLA